MVIPNSDFLDYVFVPGRTHFEIDAKFFYQNRIPKTVELTGITTLISFSRLLKIDNLLTQFVIL
jgi:hypothetical protein